MPARKVFANRIRSARDPFRFVFIAVCQHNNRLHRLVRGQWWHVSDDILQTRRIRLDMVFLANTSGVYLSGEWPLITIKIAQWSFPSSLDFCLLPFLSLRTMPLIWRIDCITIRFCIGPSIKCITNTNNRRHFRSQQFILSKWSTCS